MQAIFNPLSFFTSTPSEQPASSLLTNPEIRRDIRADFPETMGSYDVKAVLKVIDQELQKHGTNLQNVKRIAIAYPHKHPGRFPSHCDDATYDARQLQKSLTQEAPHVQWIMADGICETMRLDRSGNQTSAHALMAHQIFEIHKPSQKQPLPFIDTPQAQEEFFIVTDHMMEQGTTVANLISYLEHNGGYVLAATPTGYEGNSIAQQANPDFSYVSLSKKFNDASRNTARLSEMAYVFSQSVRKDGLDWTPEQCMETFHQCLEKNGHSVYALTNGECKRLIDTVNGNYYEKSQSFLSMITQLAPEIAAAARKKPAITPYKEPAHFDAAFA